jgi:hypothetical protein
MLHQIITIRLSHRSICTWWWKCNAVLLRASTPCSICSATGPFYRPAQYISVEHIRQIISMGDLIYFPSKQTLFLVFQTDQQTTANPTKNTYFPSGKNRLIHTQYYVNEFGLTVAPKLNAMILQTYLTIGHSNIKCLTDSASWQNTHAGLPFHFLLSKLSLVRIES